MKSEHCVYPHGASYSLVRDQCRLHKHRNVRLETVVTATKEIMVLWDLCPSLGVM